MYTSLSLPKIKKAAELLKKHSACIIEKDLPLRAKEVFDYKESNTPPEGDYLPFKTVAGRDKRYWIRLDFKTPSVNGDEDIYLEIKTGIEGSDLRNPQGIFYANEKMLQGIDINHREVRLLPSTEYSTYTYFYSGTDEDLFEVTYDLIKINRRVEKLYYDIEVPYEACRDVYAEGSYEYATVLSVLERAVNLLDLRSPESEEFYNSVAAAEEFLAKELYGKLCSSDGKPTVSCIGHTHIDVEWLWDRRQTREKIQRSASTAIALMQDYPEYVFTLSQPELYRYLKEEAPDKYAELKKLVRCGRWEPEGALYLECDCNISSGESIVRQLMHGKKFFKDEFGIDSEICLLPDVFGYSAALPQILKGADVNYFVTSKISWNDTNTMPHDAFIWRGIDGSEIFTSFITGQFHGRENDRRNTYNGKINPSFIKGTWERFKEKSYTDSALNTYGFGDGGGGPTREMLEHGRRLSLGLPGMPIAKFDTLKGYLDKAASDFAKSSAELRRTPRWVGELYLERHRATYTTMGKVKRANRKSELALTKLESLYAIGSLEGKTYDKAALNEIWRDTLHNQFHDILPGSSVESVYGFTDSDYERILGYAESNIEKESLLIAKRVNTDGGLFVYNDAGFWRTVGYCAKGGFVESTAKIPPFGYAVIEEEAPKLLVSIEGLRAESPYYVAKLDERGRIISLYDKENERELVAYGERMNEFRVFEDYPNLYDAWEFEEYMELKPYILGENCKIDEIYDGERAGFQITVSYKSSLIREKIWFYSKSRRIDLEFDIDWYEKMNTLKLAFPTSISTDKVKCDIQFGHIERATHRNTDWDKAKFEICAHKWIDASEYGYGIAILSDSKYGYSAEGGKISCTLIKCPTFPNPGADVGNHVFSYALLPHKGDLCEAGIIQEAHSFNRPMRAIKLNGQAGDLSDEFSLISADNPAVIIESVKPAEDGRGIIARIYEAYGSLAKARIKLPDGAKKAKLTNLLERDGKEIEIKDGAIKITAHPFEIITLRIEK